VGLLELHIGSLLILGPMTQDMENGSEAAGNTNRLDPPGPSRCSTLCNDFEG
jgi:hypothetical protein